MRAGTRTRRPARRAAPATAPPPRRANIRAKRPGRPRAAAPVRDAGLEKLWAPWRMDWLRHADEPQGCLFCRVAAERNAKAGRRDLVLARNAHALLMLNRYPYASAHLMVAVNRHAGQFHELTSAEMLDVQSLVALAERALAAEYAPHGLNYGLNVGRVAGAGFPGHFHLHVVPRWNGDTNFMPAIAQTRVLPESLDATWSRLLGAIAVLAGATPARPERTARGPKRPRGTGRRGTLRPANAGAARSGARRGA